MRNSFTKKLVLSGLFLALGFLMPFLTGQIPSIGNKLLPMHIPVILTGFICGWPYGLIVGLVVPIFRSILLGMPPLFPIAIAMTFELGTYGFMAGFLYKLFPRKRLFVYITLILAMIGGRIIWGFSSFILYGLSNTIFTWKIFMAGAFLKAVPGIIVQIIVIPIIIMALTRTKLIGND